MKFVLALIILLFPLTSSFAVNNDLRDTDSVTVTGSPNGELATFVGPILEFFYTPSLGAGSIEYTFLNIASGVKNFFIAIAVVFLIISIIKLLFAGGDEERIKKWKRNILWVSLGILAMQIAFPVWKTLFLKDANFTSPYINGQLGWMFWTNIFEPIVGVLLLLASLGFLAMGVYAFYTLVTAGGDEEQVKKGKNIIIYAIIGFLLVRIPKVLVTAIYGKPSDGCRDTSWFSIGSCMIAEKDLAGTVSIFGKILTYVSGFLGIVAVALVIYAGFIVFTSQGEEERLKKAKNIVLWIGIGFILLVASHAIFRFFFLRG